MISINKLRDYTLMFFLIAISGIPFFLRSNIFLLFPLTLLVIAIAIFQGRKLHKFFGYYLLVLILVQMGQALDFYYISVRSIIALHIRLFYVYFSIVIIGKKFFKYYVDIIYVLALVSFFFYALQWIAPGLIGFISSNISPHLKTPFDDSYYVYYPDVIFYVFHPGFIVPRNSGAFWEPGAHAGFLIVGLIFSLIENKRFTKKSIVMSIALITTISTTAYLALIFLITAFVMSNAKPAYKAIVLPAILIGGIIAFTSFDFLGDKIRTNMDYKNAAYNTRFGSAALDISATLEHPIFGLGTDPKTRFAGETNRTKIHRNNGITGLLSGYGFLIFILYFGLIYYTYYKLCRQNGFKTEFALYGLALIFIIGFSEAYFTKPIFLALTMVHVIVGNYQKPELQENTES